MTQPSLPSPACRHAEQLAASGRGVEGYRLLEQATKSGDAEAAFLLGQWRLSGQIVRRDLELSRHFFGRSASLGRADAFPIYVALLANGAGGIGRDWTAALALLHHQTANDQLARRQVDLLERMALDASGDPNGLPDAILKSESPQIRTAKSLLSADECAYLRSRATPVLQPAVIVDPSSGRMMPDPIRTSSSAAFPFVVEDPVIHAINRRIAAITGTTYEQGEPMQVLRYRPGERYKLHNDALPHTDNQRILTLLVYLNDDYEGGATSFPAIDLVHRGRTGDAIIFRNVDADGRPDMASRHSGEPVTTGEKFLLSKWIRSKPLDLSGPPGRPL